MTCPPVVRGRHSWLKKKNSLLLPPGFPTGPPMEYPQSLSFEIVFGLPLRSFCQLLLFQSEFRSMSYTEPRNWFVPLLVTAEIWTPLERPYSAW